LQGNPRGFEILSRNRGWMDERLAPVSQVPQSTTSHRPFRDGSSNRKSTTVQIPPSLAWSVKRFMGK
jgi:hypothetical protein